MSHATKKLIVAAHGVISRVRGLTGGKHQQSRRGDWLLEESLNILRFDQEILFRLNKTLLLFHRLSRSSLLEQASVL